ncbi:MAG: VWA domain-containing protein [Deltaproteobacteria bacterium]|nr:VWA domain-containing protein [Deltaproteobacteria bacterium]
MSRSRLLFAVIALFSLALSPVALSADQGEAAPLVLILDASGSMWGQIQGENKIVIARQVLDQVVDGLPEGAPVGVVAYGHRREGDCDDIETVLPVTPLDRASLKAKIQALNPKGKTPITAAVQQAFSALEGQSGGATVILLSDGLETCGGDPCAAVRSAKEDGIDFVLHVVGFDVAKEDVSSLECAAQAGGGLFLTAENAAQLSEALEAAVALPAEVPAGRLSVKAIAGGELHDVLVRVWSSDSNRELSGGRTYGSPETNPRLIPLADGKYRVQVTAMAMKGAVSREFEVTITGDEVVEKVLDFSTGELILGVTNNGEPHDAVYWVKVPDDGAEVARGRTYTGPKQNPAKIRITSGTYEVFVQSVTIGGKDKEKVGRVTIVSKGQTQLSHNFKTGVLKVGAQRDGQLVDAVVQVSHLETGRSVGGGRTYTSADRNPRSFTLKPGSYNVSVQEVRGKKRTLTVEVKAGETVEKVVDPAGGETP